MRTPAEPLVSRWLSLDGLRLHHREGGSDRLESALPPVVLVHGLVVSGRYMVPTAALLASRLHVLVPDLPGFGRSAGPRRALDVEGLARHLDRWLATVGLTRPPLLVANSFGCQIVAELAALARPPLHGVVLTGPTVDPAHRSLFAQAARFLADTVREPPQLAGIIAMDFLRAGPTRALRTTLAALRHRVEDRLPEVTVPALVVRGERDPICPQEWAEQAAALLPQSRLEVIALAPHAVTFAAPEAVARLVMQLAEERHPPL